MNELMMIDQGILLREVAFIFLLIVLVLVVIHRGKE